MKADLDRAEMEVRARLATDFAAYAQHCLTLRSKEGWLRPFTLNRAQAELHRRVEEQRARLGKVRVIIVKGRQLGISTYVEGRLYWRVTHGQGLRSFILTHHQDATSALFEMAQRFHDHCPRFVKPVTGSASARELSFPGLHSGYKVGTAGSMAVGRGQTVQLFHGSEAAFWPNPETHAGGVMQAIPEAEGTEIYLESTANGEGNWFHRQWMAAASGDADFEAVFLPWYWAEEYTRPAEGLEPGEDELEMMDQHGLTLEQLAWRRQKISDLGSAQRFRQEYPLTPEEAFQADTTDVVIPARLIRSAVGREVEPTQVKPLWGLDVARFGDDRTALAKRRGNVLLEKVRHWSGKDLMQTCGLVYTEWEETPEGDRPSDILVDAIGIGAGVADRLREMQLPARSVNVAESSSTSELYMRKRDELWFEAGKWFEDRQCSMPRDDALIMELGSVKYAFTSAGRRKVESKDDMRKRDMPSPDLADAFVLTFAAVPIRTSFETSRRYERGKKWWRRRERTWMSA